MGKFVHGGNVFSVAQEIGHPWWEFLDFSASINPEGPPLYLRRILEESFFHARHYPPSLPIELCVKAAQKYGISPEEIVFGNGSSELLYLIPRVVELPFAVIAVPSYVDYEKVCLLNKKKITFFYLPQEEDFRLDIERLSPFLASPSLVFLGRPNNPVGISFEHERLKELARRHRDCIFIIDEAFGDFVPQMKRAYEDRPSNVMVLLSFTKFFSIPGLRLGALIGDRDFICKIKETLPPWSVNTLSLMCAHAFLDDEDFVNKSKERMKVLREQMYSELLGLKGIKVFPSEANFFLLKIIHKDITAPSLQRKLLKHRILVRDCSNYRGLDDSFVRVAVRGEEENALLVEALKEILEEKEEKFGVSFFVNRKKTCCPKPSIMFVGTSSNAGKSVLAAGMCRILLQEGFRVAPFKAQNMSLNSFVTRDGGEMGRAQILQAQACKIEPDVRMNPILLKPNSDTGSQVIVMGKPVANMDVGEYIRFKKGVIDTVRRAYDSLAEEFDVIVVEGAGSPAEINLRSHDIVNMEMARYARANTYLIGDIDRGGVFASFVGTMHLLDIWERALIRGFIINKFRGQKGLLTPAMDYVTQVTGKPFVGIIPYIPRLGLPEEDSVSFKGLWDKLSKKKAESGVKIGCIDLPHISNFTDLDPLLLEPDVEVEIVRDVNQLRDTTFDVLIIPGSKSVIRDCDSLLSSGMASLLKEMALKGEVEIIGICGGFQMLGEIIEDPHCIESHTTTIKGLGLLPLVTTLEKEKTLIQSVATHLPSGLSLKGYEIHHGRTRPLNEVIVPVVKNHRGEEIGFGLSTLKIWGSYLHGIFDDDVFRRWFIDNLRSKKGLVPLGDVQVAFDIDKKLDELAAIMRSNMDIKGILKELKIFHK